MASCLKGRSGDQRQWRARELEAEETAQLCNLRCLPPLHLAPCRVCSTYFQAVYIPSGSCTEMLMHSDVSSLDKNSGSVLGRLGDKGSVFKMDFRCM